MIFRLKSISVAAGLFAFTAAGIAQAAPRIFPSAVGCQWSYRVSNGTQYGDKIIAVSGRSFTVKYHGVVNCKMQWIRNTAGWTTPDFKALGAVQSIGESFKIQVTGAGGVVVPRTAFWKRGYQWSFWYSMSTSGSTGPMTFTQTGKIIVENKIIGAKIVRVPDGSFHCFVVRSKLIFTGTEAVADETIPLHVTTGEKQYYALGTGLIKRTDGKTTTVLTKFVPGL